MSFEPKYESQFIGPIIANLIAAVVAKQRAAFEWVTPSDVLVGTDIYTYRGQFNGKGFWVLTGITTPIDPSTIDESIIVDEFGEWQIGPLSGLYVGPIGDDYPWQSPFTVNNGDDPAPIVARTGGLDDFKNIWASAQGRVPDAWPVMFLESAATVPVQRDDDSEMIVGHELTWRILEAGPDPDTITAKLFKRTRAVDAIWRSLESEDLLAGFDAQRSGDAYVTSIDHSYDAIWGLGSEFIRAGQLRIVIGLTER